MKNIFLIASLTLNLILGVIVWFGQTTPPLQRNGILNADVQIGEMRGTNPTLTLPKGLTVQDASPRGLGTIDLFEPHRFTITVTSEDELVDYTAPPAKKWGSLYSADGWSK